MSWIFVAVVLHAAWIQHCSLCGCSALVILSPETTAYAAADTDLQELSIEMVSSDAAGGDTVLVVSLQNVTVHNISFSIPGGASGTFSASVRIEIINCTLTSYGSLITVGGATTLPLPPSPSVTLQNLTLEVRRSFVSLLPIGAESRHPGSLIDVGYWNLNFSSILVADSDITVLLVARNCSRMHNASTGSLLFAPISTVSFTEVQVLQTRIAVAGNATASSTDVVVDTRGRNASLPSTLVMPNGHLLDSSGAAVVANRIERCTILLDGVNATTESRNSTSSNCSGSVDERSPQWTHMALIVCTSSSRVTIQIDRTSVTTRGGGDESGNGVIVHSNVSVVLLLGGWNVSNAAGTPLLNAATESTASSTTHDSVNITVAELWFEPSPSSETSQSVVFTAAAVATYRASLTNCHMSISNSNLTGVGGLNSANASCSSTEIVPLTASISGTYLWMVQLASTLQNTKFTARNCSLLFRGSSSSTRTSDTRNSTTAFQGGIVYLGNVSSGDNVRIAVTGITLSSSATRNGEEAAVMLDSPPLCTPLFFLVNCDLGSSSVDYQASTELLVVHQTLRLQEVEMSKCNVNVQFIDNVGMLTWDAGKLVDSTLRVGHVSFTPLGDDAVGSSATLAFSDRYVLLSIRRVECGGSTLVVNSSRIVVPNLGDAPPPQILDISETSVWALNTVTLQDLTYRVVVLNSSWNPLLGNNKTGNDEFGETWIPSPVLLHEFFDDGADVAFSVVDCVFSFDSPPLTLPASAVASTSFDPPAAIFGFISIYRSALTGVDITVSGSSFERKCSHCTTPNNETTSGINRTAATETAWALGFYHSSCLMYASVSVESCSMTWFSTVALDTAPRHNASLHVVVALLFAHSLSLPSGIGTFTWSLTAATLNSTANTTAVNASWLPHVTAAAVFVTNSSIGGPLAIATGRLDVGRLLVTTATNFPDGLTMTDSGGSNFSSPVVGNGSARVAVYPNAVVYVSGTSTSGDLTLSTTAATFDGSWAYIASSTITGNVALSLARSVWNISLAAVGEATTSEGSSSDCPGMMSLINVIGSGELSLLVDRLELDEVNRSATAMSLAAPCLVNVQQVSFLSSAVLSVVGARYAAQSPASATTVVSTLVHVVDSFASQWRLFVHDSTTVIPLLEAHNVSSTVGGSGSTWEWKNATFGPQGNQNAVVILSGSLVNITNSTASPAEVRLVNCRGNVTQAGDLSVPLISLTAPPQAASRWNATVSMVQCQLTITGASLAQFFASSSAAGGQSGLATLGFYASSSLISSNFLPVICFSSSTSQPPASTTLLPTANVSLVATNLSAAPTAPILASPTPLLQLFNPWRLVLNLSQSKVSAVTSAAGDLPYVVGFASGNRMTSSGLQPSHAVIDLDASNFTGFRNVFTTPMNESNLIAVRCSRFGLGRWLSLVQLRLQRPAVRFFDHSTSVPWLRCPLDAASYSATTSPSASGSSERDSATASSSSSMTTKTRPLAVTHSDSASRRKSSSVSSSAVLPSSSDSASDSATYTASRSRTRRSPTSSETVVTTASNTSEPTLTFVTPPRTRTRSDSPASSNSVSETQSTSWTALLSRTFTASLTFPTKTVVLSITHMSASASVTKSLSPAHSRTDPSVSLSPSLSAHTATQNLTETIGPTSTPETTPTRLLSLSRQSASAVATASATETNNESTLSTDWSASRAVSRSHPTWTLSQEESESRSSTRSLSPSPSRPSPTLSVTCPKPLVQGSSATKDVYQMLHNNFALLLNTSEPLRYDMIGHRADHIIQLPTWGSLVSAIVENATLVNITLATSSFVTLSTTYTINITIAGDAFECAVNPSLAPTLTVFATAIANPIGPLLTLATQGAVIATVVPAAALAGASGGGSLQRANLQLALRTCQFSLSAPLDLPSSPTQFGFGEPNGYYIRGSVLGNVFVLCAIGAIATALIVLRIFMGPRPMVPFAYAAGSLALPGWLVSPFAALLQPTVMSSVTIVLNSENPVDYLIGGIGIGACGLGTLYFALLTTVWFSAIPVENGPKRLRLQQVERERAALEKAQRRSRANKKKSSSDSSTSSSSDSDSTPATRPQVKESPAAVRYGEHCLAEEETTGAPQQDDDAEEATEDDDEDSPFPSKQRSRLHLFMRRHVEWYDAQEGSRFVKQYSPVFDVYRAKFSWFNVCELLLSACNGVAGGITPGRDYLCESVQIAIAAESGLLFLLVAGLRPYNSYALQLSQLLSAALGLLWAIMVFFDAVPDAVLDYLAVAQVWITVFVLLAALADVIFSNRMKKLARDFEGKIGNALTSGVPIPEVLSRTKPISLRSAMNKSATEANGSVVELDVVDVPPTGEAGGGVGQVPGRDSAGGGSGATVPLQDSAAVAFIPSPLAELNSARRHHDKLRLVKRLHQQVLRLEEKCSELVLSRSRGRAIQVHSVNGLRSILDCIAVSHAIRHFDHNDRQQRRYEML